MTMNIASEPKIDPELVKVEPFSVSFDQACILIAKSLIPIF